MKKLVIGFASGALLLLSYCSPANNNSANSNAENSDTTKLPPVETKEANTKYPPAFEGQTRISGVKTNTAYEGKVLTSDLKNPWAIITLPDGRFFVNEKAGTMRIVTADGKVGEPISGVPAVNSNGQGGLLDVALDPSFSSNRMIYWTYSENVEGGSLTSVAKGRLSDDEKSLENVAVIYRATPAYKGNLHYGSRILFDKEGHIIFSTGERSDIQTRPQAQDLQSGLGKLIRITTDGQPAPGNPFSAGEARPEFYSYGHRNVQSLDFHPVTGDLWEAEFGPRGGDELNLIQPGKNYGWPTITYGIEYSGKTIGDGITKKDGMEQPVYYWDPVLSPGGMIFYTGDSIPEWKNNLFIGGLSSMHIARLVIENNKVVGEERILGGEDQRFRDITQGKDGALYAVTDQGRLYRIGRK